MSDSVRGISWRDDGAGEADATLRLLAAIDAPAGLGERVLAGALAAPRPARVLAWRGSSMSVRSAASGWLRSAAAAAIVCVVAGGGWGIYSRVQPQQAPGMAATPVRAGFATAGDVARPHTLDGPSVQQQAASTGAATKPATHKVHGVQTAAADRTSPDRTRPDKTNTDRTTSDRTNPNKAVSGKGVALPAAPVQ
jgi:hypothetical protein